MGSLTPVLRHLPEAGLKAVSLLWPPNGVVLARNVAATWQGTPWIDYVAQQGDGELSRAVNDALGWLCRSQDRVGSGGVGCDELYRWTSGYPEVTGYIIPTFWDAAARLSREDLRDRAIRMAEWELRMQRPDGGWEGGYAGDGLPSTVFNTGQVLRGLIRTWQETDDGRFLDAAVRGADWIVGTQESDGSWARANFKGLKRVYDSYVAAPLVRLGLATGEERFIDSARLNGQFVLGKQHDNGWFEDADNSPYFNQAPVTHTICYTIEGLLETGELMRDDDLSAAGMRAAAALLHRAEIWPRLFARADSRWQPASSYVCLTGCAQLALVFRRVQARSGDARYLNATLKLVDFLVWAQQLNGVGLRRRGAVAGSFPIWGLYCPLKYPSWAAKYFVDVLLGLVAEPLAHVR